MLGVLSYGLANKLAGFVADHLPKRVVYFAYIRVWAFATSGRFASTHPLGISADVALERWEQASFVNRSRFPIDV